MRTRSPTYRQEFEATMLARATTRTRKMEIDLKPLLDQKGQTWVEEAK